MSCCLRGRARGTRGEEERPPQVLVELDGTLGPWSCLLPSWHMARAELAAHLKRELLMCDISLVHSNELGGGRAGDPLHTRPSLPLEHGLRAGGAALEPPLCQCSQEVPEKVSGIWRGGGSSTAAGAAASLLVLFTCGQAPVLTLANPCPKSSMPEQPGLADPVLHPTASRGQAGCQQALSSPHCPARPVPGDTHVPAGRDSACCQTSSGSPSWG